MAEEFCFHKGVICSGVIGISHGWHLHKPRRRSQEANMSIGPTLKVELSPQKASTYMWLCP